MSPNHPKLIRSDGTVSIGACDDSTGFIYINELLSESYFKKVLTHELAHAIIFSYGIKMPVAQEELLCDFTATYADEVVKIREKLL